MVYYSCRSRKSKWFNICMRVVVKHRRREISERKENKPLDKLFSKRSSVRNIRGIQYNDVGAREHERSNKIVLNRWQNYNKTKFDKIELVDDVALIASYRIYLSAVYFVVRSKVYLFFDFSYRPRIARSPSKGVLRSILSGFPSTGTRRPRSGVRAVLRAKTT